MRYLVKTYLGDPKDIETTPLDMTWYDGLNFGIHTCSLTKDADKNLYAIWGYERESVEELDGQWKQQPAFMQEPTILLSTGASAPIHHNKEWSIVAIGDKYRNTQYFYGLEHEQDDHVGNCIHARHWKTSINEVLKEVDTKGSYNSSDILWLWDIRADDDPNFSVCNVTVGKSPVFGYFAYHNICGNNDRRLSNARYVRLYDAACSAFTIRTFETYKEGSKSLGYIDYVMGSVHRKFPGSFTSSDDLNTSCEWTDGLCLLNHATADNIPNVQILQPDNSTVAVFRASDYESTDPKTYAEAITGISYLDGGKAGSLFIGSDILYCNNPSLNLADNDCIHFGNIVFRMFDIDQSKGKVKNKIDQDDSSFLDNFITDYDQTTFNSVQDWQDTDNEWYQIVVI